MALDKSQLHRPWPGQRVLAALASLGADGACVWSKQLRAEAEVTTSQLNHAATGLLNKNYIARCYYLDGPRKYGGYRITTAGLAAHRERLTLKSGSGQTEPRANTGARVRAWGVMRFRKKFSLDDLEMLCAQGEEAALRSNLQKYVKVLEKARYLLPLRGHRWMLVRDHGPQAPVWSARRRTLIDPNSGDVYVL